MTLGHILNHFSPMNTTIFAICFAHRSTLLSPLPLAWFVYCEDSELGGEADSMGLGMLALVLFYIVAFFLMSYFLNEEEAVENGAR